LQDSVLQKCGLSGSGFADDVEVSFVHGPPHEPWLCLCWNAARWRVARFERKNCSVVDCTSPHTSPSSGAERRDLSYFSPAWAWRVSSSIKDTRGVRDAGALARASDREDQAKIRKVAARCRADWCAESLKCRVKM
jgi:hypothetical protein